MSKVAPVWHGTDQEAEEFTRAIDRNCTCSNAIPPEGILHCAAHELAGGQDIVDHMLFARRINSRLEEEEMKFLVVEEDIDPTEAEGTNARRCQKEEMTRGVNGFFLSDEEKITVELAIARAFSSGNHERE